MTMHICVSCSWVVRLWLRGSLVTLISLVIFWNKWLVFRYWYVAICCTVLCRWWWNLLKQSISVTTTSQMKAFIGWKMDCCRTSHCFALVCSRQNFPAKVATYLCMILSCKVTVEVRNKLCTGCLKAKVTVHRSLNQTNVPSTDA